MYKVDPRCYVLSHIVSEALLGERLLIKGAVLGHPLYISHNDKAILLERRLGQLTNHRPYPGENGLKEARLNLTPKRRVRDRDVGT